MYKTNWKKYLTKTSLIKLFLKSQSYNEISEFKAADNKTETEREDNLRIKIANPLQDLAIAIKLAYDPTQVGPNAK